MLARRRRRVVVFGLRSTAKTIVEASAAKVIGTMCGRPWPSTVASRATRLVKNRFRAASYDGRTIGCEDLATPAGQAFMAVTWY